MSISSGSNLKGNILFILTSHSQLGDTGKPTGYYLPELAHPYEVLSKEYRIRFVTPKGGKSPVDPSSVDAFRSDPVCTRFIENALAVSSLENTEPLSSVTDQDISQLAGVFFPGGHGPMFDLATDETSARIVRKVYEQGGIISAVCHGPAGIVNVKLSNGDYLVSGHQVTCFSNAEEDSMELSNVVPFMLEDLLREHGASYSKAAEQWGEHVVGQGTRLITGQNPKSSFAMANALLDALNAAQNK
ncbi:class I glutamine amidotransferase-like protein [Syncephalis plumigaleata]|nr:class I glutamine amidotransferase-like protein [Syncephalis plumigaleata]